MPARPNDSGDSGVFVLKVITSFPGSRYLETKAIRFTSRSSAYEACDRIQDDLDADCDPARVYVCDSDGIPIRAGRCASHPSNYFFQTLTRNRRRAA